MLNKGQLEKLHTNQRLFVIEMQKRDIDVTLLSKEMELIEARYKNHREIILDRDSSIIPYSISIVCGDKYLTKKLLQKDKICVPEGEQFFFDEIDKASLFAKKIGFPVVVKPIFGSHGDNVFMDLNNSDDVVWAIKRLIKSPIKSKGYIVEKQFDGKEYRVFIAKNGEFAVLHRDPAHVIGDGINPIHKLIEIENYKRANPRLSCLCNILLDEVSHHYMENNKISLDYVPKQNQKIYIRASSNVAKGGTCTDYTNIVHPSVIQICKNVLDTFGRLPYAGIDFLSKDISKLQTRDIYRILEVNTVPGIAMHMRPGTGKPRNVAKCMVDMIFPESRKDYEE